MLKKEINLYKDYATKLLRVDRILNNDNKNPKKVANKGISHFFIPNHCNGQVSMNI
jgi:hypothetical protein